MSTIRLSNLLQMWYGEPSATPNMHGLFGRAVTRKCMELEDKLFGTKTVGPAILSIPRIWKPCLLNGHFVEQAARLLVAEHHSPFS